MNTVRENGKTTEIKFRMHSVETDLRSCGNCGEGFIANILRSQTVKGFTKSANVQVMIESSSDVLFN